MGSELTDNTKLTTLARTQGRRGQHNVDPPLLSLLLPPPTHQPPRCRTTNHASPLRSGNRRQKELDELSKLKEKQAKRRVLRAEEEKKLLEQKKQEEEKKKEQEEKKKKLEEEEKARQAKAERAKTKKTEVKKAQVIRGGIDSGKTKDQIAEEKQITLNVRCPPLEGNAEWGQQEIIGKINDLWKVIAKRETEKYDLEMKDKEQTYELTELREKRKSQLQQKALKRGLDADALCHKHPPKIQTASKFERRPDSKTYDDKKIYSKAVGKWFTMEKQAK